MASAKQIKKKRREELPFFADVSGYRTGHQQAPPGKTQMLVACQPGPLCATSLWEKKVIPGIGRNKRGEQCRIYKRKFLPLLQGTA